MALIDKVYSPNQKPTADLRINGVLVNNWISLRGGDAFNTNPWLDIEIPALPTPHPRGIPVTLDAGYDNEHVRVATMGMLAWGDEDPDALRTQCIARGMSTEDGEQIEETASVVSPVVVWPPVVGPIDFEVDSPLSWDSANAAEVAVRELRRQARIPRRPSGAPLSQTAHAVGDLHGAFRSYKIAERDLSGQTIKQGMAGVLADSGVAAWTLDFDDYTLASEGATLARMPGSEAMTFLMKPRGCSVQQLRSGNVLVSVVEEQPAATAAFKYSTEDEAFASIYEMTGEYKVPFNPLLQIGMTIEITNRFLGIPTSNWFLRQQRYELASEGGAWSFLDLVGGEDFGGNIAVAPHAVFTYTVTLENINGVTMAVVIFDATSSYDPDGVLTGANISWSDNQGGLISGTGFRKRVVIDPATDVTGTWDVTATATDATSLTDTETQTIDTSATGGQTYIPGISVAADSYAMQTPDSAQSWNDRAGGTCTATGMRPADGVHTGHTLFGFDDGHVELTRDGNVTFVEVIAAVGSRIVDIVWDWRNTNIAWVLTDDCRLYVCLSMDAPTPAFALYGGAGLRTTLGLAGALGNLIGLPAAGGVDVFGGTGTGFPLHAFDRVVGANTWVTQVMLGDILTDGAGSSDLRIADYTAPGYGGETMILTNGGGRANGSICIYHTSGDGGGPSATFTRATGSIAGYTDGRAMLPNAPLAAVTRIAIFDDQDAHKSLDGILYERQTGVLPAGFTCNHAMWESDILTGLPPQDGVYLLALENAGTNGGVYKSVDELSSEVQVLRDDTSTNPWPSGARALKLSIGASGKSATQAGAVAVVGGVVLRVEAWDQSSTWVPVRAAMTPPYSGFGNGPTIFYRFFDGTLLVEKAASFSPHIGSIYYSAPTDTHFALVLGDDAVDDSYHPQGMDITADGIILSPYAATLFGNQSTAPFIVKRSDDKGGTWSDEYNDPGWTGGNNTEILLQPDCAIACDKWDANRVLICAGIIASGARPTFIYRDSGGWHQRTNAGPTASTVQSLIAVNNGRMILAYQTSGPTTGHLGMTDDLGGSWAVNSYSLLSGQFVICPYRASHFNRVIMGVKKTGGTSGIAISSDNASTFTDLAISDFADNLVSLEYDNAADTLYVLLDNGTLYMITAVYSGTPIVTNITQNLSAGGRVVAMQR